jgi:hypothetical protein
MMEEDYEHELACAVKLQGLQVRSRIKKVYKVSIETFFLFFEWVSFDPYFS